MPARAARRALVPLVALAALLLGLLVVPATAAVSAPAGLAASAVSGSRTPVLSWRPVAKAGSYEVQVSSDPSFATRIAGARTTNHRYVPTVSLPSGTLHWRVRTTGTDRTTSGWATSSVTVSAVAAPEALGPVDGAQLQQPQSPPVLRWSAVQGASRYLVEVDTDSDFIGASSYSTSTTSFVVADTLEPRTYHWRVRVELDKGLLSQWTVPRTFAVLALPEVQVTPVQGADDRLGTEDVHLDWEPVLGAKEYELEVSTDPGFNNTSATVEKIKVKGTRYSPPVTYLNNQYYWRVRALNAQGHPGPWPDSTPPVFQRSWPARPDLVHPADSLQTVGDDFFFEWTPVDHATRYQLDVGEDPNFSPGNFQSCYTASTTYTAGYASDGCMPSEGVVTHWRVRALDDPKGVQGIYSPIQRFVYASDAVNLVSPAHGATVAVPTMTWDALRDTERYYVEVQGANGAVVASTITYSLSWTPTTALDPTNGPFTWRVQARDTDGSPGPRYGGRTFSLAGSPESTGLAPLTATAATVDDAPTTRFPALSWEPHPDAAYYRLTMGVSGSGFSFATNYTPLLGAKIPYPAATDTTTKMLTVGAYDWFVTAYRADNSPIGQGDVATFEVVDLPPVTGQRIGLSGVGLNADSPRHCTTALGAPGTEEAQCEEVPATPVLDWDPVPGASHYIVYLAEDRELTNLVYRTPTATNVTSSTRWTPRWNHTPKALPDSVAGTAYYWVIRPCRATGICAPDPVSTNAVASHAFEKHSPRVQLIGPRAQAGSQETPTVANDVRFDWEDYLLTNQRTTGLGELSDSSHQAAMQYRFQVSTSPEFTKTLENRLVDQSTFTPFAALYPEGPLYWRVQAVDGNGNGLAWSETALVRKSSPEPGIVQPSAGTTVSDTPLLRWGATPFASSYEVEVYRNAATDTVFSPTNRVLRQITFQPAFVPTTPFPPSTEPYAWRVRRIDASGNLGQWNPRPEGNSPDPRARTLFTVRGSAPQLTSPTNGTRQPATGTLLRWTAVPGAVTYRVERSTAGSSRSETVTTRALAYAPTGTIPDGTSTWKVTALGVGNSVLGTSASRTFTVDGTGPVATLVKPGPSPKPKASFVVRFNEPVTNVSARTLTLAPTGRKKVRARVVLDSTRRVATLKPTRRLKRGVSYTLTVRAGVRDAAGNPAKVTTWSFRVR